MAFVKFACACIKCLRSDIEMDDINHVEFGELCPDCAERWEKKIKKEAWDQWMREFQT